MQAEGQKLLASILSPKTSDKAKDQIDRERVKLMQQNLTKYKLHTESSEGSVELQAPLNISGF